MIFRSIQARLTGAFVLVSVISALTVALVIQKHFKHLYYKQFYDVAEKITENLANNCRYGLWTDDQKDLRETINYCFQFPNVKYTLIENDNVILETTSFSDSIRVSLADSFIRARVLSNNGKKMVLKGNPYIHFFHPVLIQEKNENKIKTLGFIHLLFDLSSLDQTIVKTWYRIALLLLVLFAFLFLFGYLFSKKITNPIAVLVKGTKRIAEGDLSFPIAIEGKDEMVLLSSAFDQMRIQLKNKVEHLELIHVHIPLIYFLMDPKGKIVFLDHHALQKQKMATLSVSLDDFEKRICQHPDFKKVFLTTVSFLLELPPFYFLIHMTPVFDNGILTHVTGIGIELSEKMRSEREKRNLVRQIIEAEKISSLGKIAGGIAHQLNNILSIIRVEAQSSLEFDSVDYYRDSMRQVSKCTHSGGLAIKNLLNYARKTSPQFKVMFVRAVLMECIEMLSQTFKNHCISIQAEYHDQKMVSVDPVQMEQVFMNLLINAVDVMRNGGRIVVRTSEIEEYIQISIKDSGCGIPPEIQPHIFEPFFTTKGLYLHDSENAGTGLGLYVVQEILCLHHGTIVFESTGDGTEFVVRIPVSKN